MNFKIESHKFWNYGSVNSVSGNSFHTTFCLESK